MNRHMFVIALLPTLVAAPAIGQTVSRVTLTPLAGWHAPLRALGPSADTNQGRYLNLDRAEAAPSFGLSAEIALPLQQFTARLSAATAMTSSVSGSFDCYPLSVCASILLNTTAEVRSVAAMASLVYSPLHSSSSFRPFVIAGAGYKRYNFSWPDAATFVNAGEYAETTATFQAGLGAAFDLLGATFRAEVIDNFTPEGSAMRSDFGPESLALVTELPRRNAQHDMLLNLGWQVFRF